MTRRTLKWLICISSILVGFANYARAEDPLSVLLSEPGNGAVLRDSYNSYNQVRITGTATGADFASYDLQVRSVDGTTDWFTLVHGTVPISNRSFASLSVGDLPPGRIQLRLLATSTSGRTYTSENAITNEGNRISSPELPSVPNQAAWLRSGTSISVYGAAYSSTAQSYALEWAPGINADTGWSAAGVTQRGPGQQDGVLFLGSWTSPADAKGYYTIRSRLICSNWTFESRTFVLLEPALAPGWPHASLKDFSTSEVVTPQVNGGTQLVLGGGDNFKRFTLSGRELYSTFLGSGTRPASGHVTGVEGDVVAVPEIFNRLRIVRPDNSFVSTSAVGSQERFVAAPIQLVDLNGDGQSEVVAVTRVSVGGPMYLYAFNADGSLFSPKYPIAVQAKAGDSSSQVRVVAFDAHHIGHPQLWVAESGQDQGLVRKFDADGTPLGTVHVLAGEQIASIAAADLRGSGIPQIILTTQGTSGIANHVRVYNADGSPVDGWPVTLNEPIRGVVIGDLLGDGQPCVTVTGSRSITAYDSHGRILPGWPIAVPDGVVQTIVADLDGDGRSEILFATHRTTLDNSTEKWVSTRLVAVHSDGQAFDQWELPGHVEPGATYAPISFVVGNLTGTGNASIAVAYQIGYPYLGVFLLSTQLALLNLPGRFSSTPSDWAYPYADAGNSNVWRVPKRATLPAACDEVGQDQFLGCYYDDDAAGPGSFSNLTYTKFDPQINFDWGVGSPDARLHDDRFSVRWRGEFSFPGDVFEFHVTADDGVRLRVDGALVIDDWTDHPPTPHSATVPLNAGRHRVEVEYFENGGSSSVQVGWEGKTNMTGQAFPTPWVP